MFVSLSDSAPIVGAWVRAEVHRPDGTVDTLTLHDDGLQGDGVSNDGVYAEAYYRLDAIGTYRLEIQASGDVLTEPFARVASASVTVAAAPDGDADGMPDPWRARWVWTPPGTTPVEDDDRDSLLNLDEYRSGADPFVWDTDGDTLSDGQEVYALATSPTNTDTDLGGVDDAMELGRGSDPLDASDDRHPIELARSYSVELWGHGTAYLGYRNRQWRSRDRNRAAPALL